MILILERKEPKKLIINRLIFLFAFTLITSLFIHEIYDYAIFAILIFSFLFFMSNTELKIYTDCVYIKNYYLSGLIPFEYKLYKESDVKISTVDMTVSSSSLEETYTFINDVVVYRIKYKDENGRFKKFDCKLSEEEYDLIKKVLNIV